MKTPMLFAMLLFTRILLIAILPFASADIVQNTCMTSRYANFCITTLQSDPRSYTATSAVTLALIMIDKVDANSNSTQANIGELLNEFSDPRMIQALTSCQKSYNIIITALVPRTKESMTKVGYKGAADYMKAAAIEAYECEASFAGSLESPITDSNIYEHKAASVASDIAGIAGSLL